MEFDRRKLFKYGAGLAASIPLIDAIAACGQRSAEASSFVVDSNNLSSYMKDGQLDTQRLQKEAVNAGGQVTITGLDLTRMSGTATKNIKEGFFVLSIKGGHIFSVTSHTNPEVKFSAYDLGHYSGHQDTDLPVLQQDNYSNVTMTFNILNDIDTNGVIIPDSVPYLYIEGPSKIAQSSSLPRR